MNEMSCRLKMREMLHALAPKEKQIAEFILQNPQQVVHMSLEELAGNCKTS